MKNVKKIKKNVYKKLSLGVYIVKSRNLKCSLDAAKRGFYRAANSIFGKVGRIANPSYNKKAVLSQR